MKRTSHRRSVAYCVHLVEPSPLRAPTPAVIYGSTILQQRRRVDWRRLILALDVAPPSDFTDPDISFLDRLPQPYRLIVDVLDIEVGERGYDKHRHNLHNRRVPPSLCRTKG